MNRSEALFLRQSVHSNYCGVYSTAMLLSRIGKSCDRVSAFALFGLPARPRNYRGATTDEIGEAFQRVTGHPVRWRIVPNFAYRRLRALLRAHCPTLMAYGARYGDLECIHVVVATAVPDDGIELLDPLGRPSSIDEHNAVLRHDGSISGVNYTLVASHPVEVLRWE